jgi:hypothetical protein
MAVLCVAPLLSGCNALLRPALSTCELEALKAFGHLRVSNEHGILWPPHQLEYFYITSCMRAHGYILEDRAELNIGPVGSGQRAVYMQNADNWKRDYGKWLPRFARDWLT